MDYPFVILMVGGVIFLMVLVKSGLDRTSIPSLLGFLIRPGEWAVPAKVFAGMVLVSAATCIISPLAVQLLLIKQFRKGEVL